MSKKYGIAMVLYMTKQHDISIIHIQKCGVSMENFQTNSSTAISCLFALQMSNDFCCILV